MVRKYSGWRGSLKGFGTLAAPFTIVSIISIKLKDETIELRVELSKLSSPGRDRAIDSLGWESTALAERRSPCFHLRSISTEKLPGSSALTGTYSVLFLHLSSFLVPTKLSRYMYLLTTTSSRLNFWICRLY